MAKSISTPGVYIIEKNAFPNSIVPIATAAPAFVGYTEKAVLNKQSVPNVPVKISSLAEYQAYFGGGPKTLFQLESDPKTVFKCSVAGVRFFLYNCLQLYFANGGAACYIVSIGNFADVTRPAPADFFGGIDALRNEQEPTLLICPDTVGLPDANASAEVHRKMLDHCAEMQSRFAILDIWGGFQKRTLDGNDVISTFRNGIQSNLNWGATYYPWVNTNITGTDEVDFTKMAKDSLPVLAELLLAELQQSVKSGQLRDQQKFVAIQNAVKSIATTTDPDKVKQLHQTLQAVSPLYKNILKGILQEINLLPPGAGMAGIYCMVDQSQGVFKAPANVSMASVISPAVQISSAEQEDLNAPLDGKSVCAIRTFVGQGVLVWGARTLDGNSQDWRYINVRRTMIFIEQSIKTAIRAYVFEPNDANTWATVKSMIENFLTNFWREGGLAGAKPQDAFSVQIGLGSTMTAQDILDGYMRVTVLLAVSRPAEFLVITLEQKMQQS
ncbi:MAG: phage tail sheath family protein [Lewinellaceae bacterium]|nr:phage tail sheath family protein [Lewinellaceae bacterium]